MRNGLIECILSIIISECCYLYNYVYEEDIKYYLENEDADNKEDIDRIKKEIKEVQEDLGLTENEMFRELSEALSQEVFPEETPSKLTTERKMKKIEKLIRDLREIVDECCIMYLNDKYEETLFYLDITAKVDNYEETLKLGEKVIRDGNVYVERTLVQEIIENLYEDWKNENIEKESVDYEN